MPRSPRAAFLSMLWQRERLRWRGLRFVTRAVDDIDAETRRLNALGFDTVMTCRLPAVGGLRLAWYDTRKVFGAMVEVYEEGDLMRRFYSRVARAAENWHGENPVRSL